MSLFLRLLETPDKASALLSAVHCDGDNTFEVDPASFRQVPGAPFAYWVGEGVRATFKALPPLTDTVLACSGTGTLDDFRFLRCWWEIDSDASWIPFAKGGAYAPIYFDHHLVVNWADDGAEMKAWIVVRYGGGHWTRNIRSTEHYGRPGLTWPRRTQGGLSFRAMPASCIFADKGPAAFVAGDSFEELLCLLALANSRPFGLLVSLQMAFGSYEVGVIQRTPLPLIPAAVSQLLAGLGRRAWSLRRILDTVMETSHAFAIPALIRERCGLYDPVSFKAELE